jgi:flagellar biosynthesis protein FlhF
MPEALALVKRELGPEAVILGTRTLPAHGLSRLVGRDQVEITAALETALAPTTRAMPKAAGATPRAGAMPKPALRARACPTEQAVQKLEGARAGQREPETQKPKPETQTPKLETQLSEVKTRPQTCPAPKPETLDSSLEPVPPTIPEEVYPYYVRLVQQELGRELAQRVLASALERLPRGTRPHPTVLNELLRETLTGMIPTAADGEVSAARRIAFVGPPGGGKTTTLAKLAAHLHLRQKKSVALLSLDMHRLAAGEQLRRYAELIQVPIAVAQTREGVAQALRDFRDIDHILIDTPGVGLREEGRFARMAALLRATRPDEVHLVLPGSTSPAVQLRLGQAFAPLGISRLAVTRLDETIGFGVILTLLEQLQLKLSYFSTGQNVPQDFEAACGRRVAELICPPQVGA